MITVGRPFFPARRKLDAYLDRVYESGWLTNNGPLVRELEQRLKDYLGVRNLLLVTNGTLALQLAFRLLNVTGEAVTTPFTFAATSSALRWQGIQPRYADIDAKSFNLDPALAADKITADTGAIVPVHVYGGPCDVDGFRELADRHNLPLIYDAAHAFGVQHNGQGLLNAGDIATLSFHATKLFHTVEGGALIINDNATYERAQQMINFGLGPGGRIDDVGINAKMSEFHAAMGLACLDSIDDIIKSRTALVEEYKYHLADHVKFQQHDGSENGAYMPVLLPSEEQADNVVARLKKNDINPRRYFYPALHETDSYANGDKCPIASDVSRRILCLPLYSELPSSEVRRIADIVREEIG